MLVPRVQSVILARLVVSETHLQRFFSFDSPLFLSYCLSPSFPYFSVRPVSPFKPGQPEGREEGIEARINTANEVIGA